MKIENLNHLGHQSLEKVIPLDQINEYILHRLHSGIIFADEQGRIKFINEAAKKLFNYTAGTHDSSISEISPQLAEKLSQWRNDSLTTMQTKHIVFAHLEVMAHFIPGAPKSDIFVIIVFDDMRLLVQHAQQLKVASLGRFTASIAHELRNPLGAIAHAVQLLEESIHLNTQDRRLIEIINNHCDRMNNIIKNILQLSRRKRGEPERIVLKTYLANFVSEFLRFNKEPVNFKVQVADNEVAIFVDKSQLNQILTNLSENAIRYGKELNGDINIDLIADKDVEDNIFILVKDYGSGITEQAMQHLFEPFYTTSRSGMGMGLFITKELCQANQAQLSVEDSSQGACFKISFNKNEELFYE